MIILTKQLKTPVHKIFPRIILCLRLWIQSFGNRCKLLQLCWPLQRISLAFHQYPFLCLGGQRNNIEYCYSSLNGMPVHLRISYLQQYFRGIHWYVLVEREYKQWSFLSKEKKCDDRGRSWKPSSWDLSLLTKSLHQQLPPLVYKITVLVGFSSLDYFKLLQSSKFPIVNLNFCKLLLSFILDHQL